MFRLTSLLAIGLTLALALPAAPARAVTVSEPYLVKDINPEGVWGSAPSQMTAVGDTLFFETDNPEAIWKTDGTAPGTVRVADFHDMESPIAFGNLLAFHNPCNQDACDHPRGLWTSDGTMAGTRFIAPLEFGVEPGMGPLSIMYDGETLFVGARWTGDSYGLWRTDGTAEGTTLVEEGIGGQMAPFRGGLRGILWTSDGTAEGTRRIVPTGSEAPFLRPRELRIAGDLALFTSCRHGRPCQLWRSDGTDNGTFAIATLVERYDDDRHDDEFDPIVLSSTAGGGSFLVCINSDLWTSDGTVQGTRRLEAPRCSRHTAQVGGLSIFAGNGGWWRTSGTPEGTEWVGPIGGRRLSGVLGYTSEVAVYAVTTEEGGTELWQTDGTAAGTFAVSPMPSVGWFAYDDADDLQRPAVGTVGDTVFFSGCTQPPDQNCELWAVKISNPSTTDPPVGFILADVSVLKKKSRRPFGREKLLWVDRKSPKQTFIRVQVTGLGDEPAGAATLRLHVAETRDAPSKAAGRIHLMHDCSWDEGAMTWRNRPAFDGEEPLDTPSGPVDRGETVDFDVTDAIVGDGVYCFAIDSESSDGAEYYSREAGARGPELLVSRPDPAARVGVVVADAFVRDTRPDRNYGASTALQVDGKSVKRTFFRVRVRGFDAGSVRDARLRLQVVDSDEEPSARGYSGRLYEITDCGWDELTVTYKTQPAIDGPLLDELGEVECGDVIEFDVTPAITGDGVYCFALESSARDGVMYRSRETPIGGPVIVTTSEASVTSRVTLSSPHRQNFGAGSPAISADGRFVAFAGRSPFLDPAYPNTLLDIFVYDRQAETTEQVSVDSFGTGGNKHSSNPAISADGRFVAFYSQATNLVPDDTNGVGDVFVHDRHVRTTERVSVDSFGVGGNDRSGEHPHAISADGRFVAFKSWASNLVADDPNRWSDIFVHDRQERTTERVSAGLDEYARQWGGVSLSADGRTVAFTGHPAGTICTNCDPPTTSLDAIRRLEVFVHDRQHRTTELVNVYAEGIPFTNEESPFKRFAGWNPALSADGQVLAVRTPLDVVFVHDRRTGLSRSINIPTKWTLGERSLLSGRPSTSIDRQLAVSAEGRFILVSNGRSIHVHDLLTGTTEKLADGSAPSISDDGQLVAFTSAAPYLIGPVGYSDILVRVR